MPIELKVLRMTAHKAKKLLDRACPTPGPLSDPPDWLTDEQKKAWVFAIANAPGNVLKNIDKSILAGYIIAEDTHRQAAMAIQRTQLLVKSPKVGTPQQTPYLAIMNRQYVLMLRAASELGFTPCSRARIDADRAPEPRADGWEDVEA